MTNEDKAAYDALVKPQTVSDVTSAISKTDFNDHTSRDKLSEYLSRDTIPAVPFGTTLDGPKVISFCPSATDNPSNKLTLDEQRRQAPHLVGRTLTKLTLTPAKTPTTPLPKQILRIFFSLGKLSTKGTTTTTTLTDSGFLVLLNPFDASYWLLRDFLPVDDITGRSQPTSDLASLNNVKFSLARVKDGGKTLLGNPTAQLQLDAQMTFAFAKEEIRVGGVLTEEEYGRAKADFSVGASSGAVA